MNPISLVLRLIKGTALTAQEHDDNLTALKTASEELDNLKAPLSSPVLTGTPTTPTAAIGTNTTQLATTAFVKAQIANDTYSQSELDAGQLDNRYYTETEINNTVVKLTADQTIEGVKTFTSSPIVPTPMTALQAATKGYADSKAPLLSPALTGTPTAPTAAIGTNTTQLATTAFVKAQIANDTYSKTEIDDSVVNLTGDQTKTGTLTLESSPIIPDPTSPQHAASKNYVDIRTGLDPLIYSLGQPGEIGFGVATAPKALYEQIGAILLSGHDVLGHENYGNYMHGYSGAILCFVPKNYIKITGNLTEYATVPTTGYVLDRSFINGGIEIPGVFVAKYPITKNGTIASAQRFKDPMSTNSSHNPISTLAGTPVNNYGGLYTAVKTMSAEAFLTPAYHYSMLARMAKAHGEAALSTTACAFIDVLPKLPKGCNNNALADAQDASVLYASSGYSNCGLTGSASNFAKTTHNGQACGIADLNGNMWEVASGFIRYTANGFLMLKESVDIRTIMNDSITAGAGGAYDLNLYDVVDISDVVFDVSTVYFGNGTNQVFAMSTDRASAAYKRTMFGIPAATGVSATGTTDFGNDGFYRNLIDQMACLRGGGWDSSSDAGPSTVFLNAARTYSHYGVCGRASFLCV